MATQSRSIGLDICSTIDYGAFVVDASNRPINQAHLKRLCGEIGRKNLLAEYPILVTRDMRVIDGQHRLEAAKQLRVPIYYMVSDRVDSADILTTNQCTLRWTQKDYLDHWCKEGKVDYRKLVQFMERYPIMSLKTAIQLTQTGYMAIEHYRFKNGEYRCNALPFATKVADALVYFSKRVSFCKQEAFVTAIATLFKSDGYDHEVMKRKMEIAGDRLVRCADAESYLRLLEGIYNHGARQYTYFKLNKSSGRSALQKA